MTKYLIVALIFGVLALLLIVCICGVVANSKKENLSHMGYKRVIDVVQEMRPWELAEYICCWRKEDITEEELVDKLLTPVSQCLCSCGEDSDCNECGCYYPDGCVYSAIKEVEE